MADVRHIEKSFLSISQQPIEILRGETFFTEFRQSDRYPCIPQIGCFPNALLASASGAFSYRLRYTWLKLKYPTGQNPISRQPCEIFIPKFLDLYGSDPATILKLHFVLWDILI